MNLWKRRKTRRPAHRSPCQSVLEQLEDRTLLTPPILVPIDNQFVALNFPGPIVTVTATDSDNSPAGTDPITLTARLADGGLLPDWLTFFSVYGSGTGTFSSSSAVGSADVKVTATDSNGETDTDTFTIVAFDGFLSVSDSVENQPVGVHTPFELDVNSVFIDTTGPVPRTITLSATLSDGTTLPAWLTFTPATGLFTGTPLDGDIGAIDVKLTGTTPDGAAAIDIFSIVVPLNHTPQFVKGANQTHDVSGNPQSADVAWGTEIYEGPPEEYEQTLTFVVTTDNNALFSLKPAISIDETGAHPLSGRLTYTLAAGANGTANVTVTLKDNGGGTNTSDSQMFVITVAEATSALVSLSATPIANQTVGVHTRTSFSAAGAFTGGTRTLSATRSNGNALPAWLTFTPGVSALGTDMFSGIPSDADIGSIDVTVTATDAVGDTVSQTFTINVPLNHTPQFLKGDNQSVSEDAGAVTVAPWATLILKGPPYEDGQTLTFLVTTNNNALFSVLPAISDTGTLTFTPADDAIGTATITVQLMDNGGNASGGDDASDSQSFTITVAPVNDPPSFTLGNTALTALEDAGLVTVPSFATNRSVGPADEATQSLTAFSVTQQAGGSLTFTTFPTISVATGTLTFQVAPNVNGTATFDVTLADNGGGTNVSAVQTFTITVTAVNDAPTFTLVNPPAVAESAGPQTETIASAFDAGPDDEDLVQGFLTFNLTAMTTTGNLTFVSTPTINLAGELSYEPTPGSSGSATFNLTLTDDGGTDNLGVNTSAVQSFTITVNGTNNPPTIDAPGAQTTDEDTALVISGLSFADPDAGAADVTVTLMVGAGTLTISTSVAGGVTAAQVTGNGSATVTITATLTELNTTLANAAGLTYRPDLNVIGADTLDIEIDDNGNSGSGGAMTATDSVGITIDAINDPPTFEPGAAFADLEVSLTAGLVTIPSFLEFVLAGGPDELQDLTITLTTDRPGLFRVLPAITLDDSDPLNVKGTLTFTPARGFGGTATVTITIQDDGGTDDGGDDTSTELTFTITTFLADLTYTSVAGAKVKAVVVNGLLNVQLNNVLQSRYLPAYVETITINGGSKDDLVNLTGLSPTAYPRLTSIVVNGLGGKDSITFNAIGTEDFEELDSVTFNGGDGNDFINLSGLPAALFPLVPSIALNGGSGNDTILGSEMSDAITGGTGDDSLRGAGGIDRLVETANASFKLTDVKLTGVGTDKLAGIEQALLTGLTGNNKLDASLFTGDTTLFGGAGNDTLLGGTGDDALLGEAGKDSLLGGAGEDSLLGGIGNDTLKGGADDDTVIGGDGADQVDGEAGTNVVLGGEGGGGRGSDGLADAGDIALPLGQVDETFSDVFDFEL